MVRPAPKHDRILSEYLYLFLLRAYPRAFREEYGSEMQLVFQDAYREARHQRGTTGIVQLWGEIVCDFVKSVCIEHTRSWMQRDRRDLALTGKDQLAMALQFTLDFAQRTDVGRTRANNEDNLLSVVPQDDQLLQAKGALFVVSDGLGGHSRGDVASKLTIEKVNAYYYQDLQNDIPTALQAAIKQANTIIYQENEAEKARGGSDFSMGATCVAAVLHDQSLYTANVGDSRAYILHEGQLRQMTHDHSIVALLVEHGELTPAQARTDKSRNQIYRALGSPSVKVDVFIEPVQQGDTLILCTDGLCEMIEDEELCTIVEQYGPEESVEQFIARANEKGSTDNVTAIVVRVAAA